MAQEQLGEATALTRVLINRSPGGLRTPGLVSMDVGDFGANRQQRLLAAYNVGMIQAEKRASHPAFAD